MQLSPGAVLGSYRLSQLLERGNGYQLWSAAGAGRSCVTLQWWTCSAAQVREQLDAFVRCRAELDRLGSCGIVPLLECFVHHDQPVLVFELAEFESLATYRQRRGVLDVRQTSALLSPVCEALQLAHASGLVHGRLSPEQVVVVRGAASAAIYDFSAHRFVSSSQSGPIRVPSRAFVPPELVDNGDGVASAAGDVWGFGALLWHCLRGGPPPSLEAGAVLETLAESGSANPPLAGLPPELNSVLQELLTGEPERRLRDLGRVSALLDSCARPSRVDGLTERAPSSWLNGVEAATDDGDGQRINGQRIIGERFELLGTNREGGMGRVHKALDTRTRRLVAVKFLHANPTPEVAFRFQREASLLSELQHPALVEYVAHGQTDEGEPYLAMEWLEGTDLQDYLTSLSLVEAPNSNHRLDSTARAVPRITADEVLALGYRIASAAALLHERGVVHRDIKPANIFVVDGRIDQCKLIDLGVASLGGAEPGITQAGELLGTPAYMSPEQAAPKGQLGPASDVWAIGCVVYECLTAQRAFPGQNLMAVLAKIVLESPPSLELLRPDLPGELTHLVGRMLTRDPQCRPRDGHALARAFAKQLGTWTSRGDSLVPSVPNSLTMREQRFGSVLLVEPPPAGCATEALVACVEQHGGRASVLMDGSLLCTPKRALAVKDDAVTTARVALALQHLEPQLKMGMALGSVTDDEFDGGGDASFGNAIDDVVRCLAESKGLQIYLNDASAALLEPFFSIRRQGAMQWLGQEREAESTRTLLGQPSVWVGRQRELGILTSLFEEVVEAQQARALVVTAPAGMGKTRLRREFVKELRKRKGSFELIMGHGDSLSAGSPFVMLAPGIRRLAGIVPGESPEQRACKLLARIGRHVPEFDAVRVAAFIGEMIGVPFTTEDESLHAARKDPMLMSERTQSAWEQWLMCECAAQPVVLILEDLHWGDSPSVKYVEAALGVAAQRPLLVVALARPELDTLFPALWAKREPERVRLRGLSETACRSLVSGALGEDVDGAVVSSIIDRAEGNAFFLEELIRMVAEGVKTQLPATILGMVQSRLDAFGAPAKRILRAASVFGEVFWQRGVAALLGSSYWPFSLEESLVNLERAEVITRSPSPRFASEVEYKFRHALLRDGAYETLTVADRTLGHRLAAQWLDEAGEQDALVLAEHSARGHDPDGAGRWFQVAAEQALDANDLTTVVRCCERAVACEVGGAQLGRVRALEAEAAYWQGEYERATSVGGLATDLLIEGSSEWFQAVGTTIVASARLGNYDDVKYWLDSAIAQTAPESAASEQLICLCRGAFQLVFAAKFERADRVLERIGELMDLSSELDALALAQANHVRGVRAAHVGDVSTFLRFLQEAIANFERAGDRRNVRLETTTLAWCYAEIGELRQAEQICRDNLAECQRIGAQQAVTYAKVNLGYILACSGEQLDEARQLLQQAIDECHSVGNPRLAGWAEAHLSTVELLADNAPASSAHAARAVTHLELSPGLKAWALSCQARASLALGDATAALAFAGEAMDILRRLGGLLQGETLPPLTLAQAYAACGNIGAARQALRDAVERLQLRAGRIAARSCREDFLRLPENALTLRLAAQWGV